MSTLWRYHNKDDMMFDVDGKYLTALGLAQFALFLELYAYGRNALFSITFSTAFGSSATV